MATYLYRLGRYAFRRRRLVAGLWFAALALAVGGAVGLSGPTSDAFSIPGTESQKALDMLAERFPEAAAGGATARVVIAAPDGGKLTDPANRAAVGRLVTGLAAVPEVVSVTDPYRAGGVNEQGTVGYAQATFAVQSPELDDTSRDALAEVARAGRDAGLTVEMGGDALQEEEAQNVGEIAGVAVAAVVLVITFGSVIAAGLPLLTALLGIAIGLSAITAATGFIDLSASTSTLALMLGLAVAIDYALLIVSRYRHELSLGRDGEQAAGRAVGTAGSAVVFAGLTVFIALAALSVVGIPFLTQMGLAAAFTVLVAVLIALTLLPAMLGFAGRRILGRRLRARDPEGGGGAPGLGLRWARAVTRRPVTVLVAGVLGLGVLAIPALDLQLAMPDDSAAAPASTQRKAYELLADGFGAGFNGPLTIVVDAAGSADPAAAAERAAAAVRALPGVVAVTPARFNQAGNTALMTAIPATGPSEAGTEDLVYAIRGQDGALRAATDASLTVTGQTAIDLDVSGKLRDALLPYLAVVVGLALLLLTLVFRSLLVPLKATLGFLLSVAATFGAVVAVFQWGWLAGLLGVAQTAPIVSFMPIFLIGVVFGLAMDYQMFLVTRMREEYVHGAGPTEAVVAGFGHGARVVTAAAIIMTSVFAGFILSPESFIKSIGFALGIAVLFDAFVVRMTIVPAAMALLGRAAWWLPRWLDRVLPVADVEGERLRHLLDGGADGGADGQGDGGGDGG
ncbi:MAG TPA: MMPL family transporter, partial [Pilimelia sp.]|nr:MMPL family transporter [Pilimelia sp.]